MAACSSNGELSGQFSIENDSDSSDFSDSDSDEEQTIDDNIYGQPHDVEGRNFAENDEDIESVGSDFDSDDNQNVYVNEVSEIAFVNEDTVGQVFISNERDDASTDTSTTSNPPRPRKRRRVTTGTKQGAYNNNNRSSFGIKTSKQHCARIPSQTWSNSCVGR